MSEFFSRRNDGQQFPRECVSRVQALGSPILTSAEIWTLVLCFSTNWNHPLGYKKCGKIELLGFILGYTEAFLVLNVQRRVIICHLLPVICLRGGYEGN